MTDFWDDGAVGYGRPPRHSRFRKGRSGNPRGRPSDADGLAALLRAALDAPVTIEAGRRRRRIRKIELVIARLVDRAADGEWHSVRQLLDIIDRLERRGAPPAHRPVPYDAGEDPREILRRKLDRWAEAMTEEEKAAARAKWDALQQEITAERGADR